MREHEREFYYEDNYDYNDIFFENEQEREHEIRYAGEYSNRPVKNSGSQTGLTKKGLALLMVCCIFVSAIFGAGGAFLANYLSPITTYHTFGSAPLRAAPMNIDLAEATGSALSIQEIIAVAGDAVVEINIERPSSTRFGQRIVQQGAGSGVIMSTDGFIMTNHHVIAGSNRITVTLRNGNTFNARLVGYDRATDVAVIKIDTTGLTPAIFGNSENVAEGDLAVVIGNPLGQLGGTATVGIISALDRQITIENQSMTLLQTDASINRGNSGGGIFNQYGELVGLVVAKSHGLGVEGLGFAIPVDTAKDVAMSLVEHGVVTGRPQIGIVMIDISTAEQVHAHGVRLPGIYIVSVDAPNAQAAGLMEGDMLHYISDVPINSFADVTAALQKHRVGDIITIVVFRDNEVVTLSVELSEQGMF